MGTIRQLASAANEHLVYSRRFTIEEWGLINAEFDRLIKNEHPLADYVLQLYLKADKYNAIQPSVKLFHEMQIQAKTHIFFGGLTKDADDI